MQWLIQWLMQLLGSPKSSTKYLYRATRLCFCSRSFFLGMFISQSWSTVKLMLHIIVQWMAEQTFLFYVSHGFVLSGNVVWVINVEAHAAAHCRIENTIMLVNKWNKLVNHFIPIWTPYGFVNIVHVSTDVGVERYLVVLDRSPDYPRMWFPDLRMRTSKEGARYGEK